MNQLGPSRHCTGWIPVFDENTYYKLDHKGYHHNQDWVFQQFHIVISGRFCNLWRSPKALFIFEDTIFTCSSDFKLA